MGWEGFYDETQTHRIKNNKNVLPKINNKNKHKDWDLKKIKMKAFYQSMGLHSGPCLIDEMEWKGETESKKLS